MFSTNLKRPLLALAVTAGLLAVAGPASAGTTNEPKGSSFLDMSTTETLDLAVSIWAPGDGSDFVAGPASANIVYNGHAGLGSAGLKFDSNEWAEAVDKDLNQPDMGIREQPTQVNAPHGLSIGSSEVFELNTIRSNGDGNDLDVAGPTGLKFDSNEWAEDIGFTAPSEMDANANASMPDVDDEVLASIYYEPDFF